MNQHKRLTEYCKIDIKLSDFLRIQRDHINVHLVWAFEDVINYGRFVDFQKVIEAMLLFPEQNFDSFKRGQLESKKWLIHELNEMKPQHEPQFLIVGGWHGLLVLLLKHYAFFEHTVLTTDIDPDCTKIARMFGCVASTVDMFEIEYDIVPADTIINTSCEHIDFDKWIDMIPKGKTAVLQSSDLEYKNHIDNVYSIVEFIERAKLSEVYTAISRHITSRYDSGLEYNRYLLIGKK